MENQSIKQLAPIYTDDLTVSSEILFDMYATNFHFVKLISFSHSILYSFIFSCGILFKSVKTVSGDISGVYSNI